MTEIEKLLDNSSSIEKRLQYVFSDKSLLALSFVHRSFVNENRDLSLQHNERLEFLGDSVLGLLMAEYLFVHLPDHQEGDLSRLRSRLVESSSCCLYVQSLQVGDHLLLGKGERMNDGRGRDTLLANLFEALIGAIYLDGGIIAAKHFLFGNCEPLIRAIIDGPMRNWKAELQDYTQKRSQKTPSYVVLDEMGPDHSKTFHVSVRLAEQEIGRGVGASKKEASQAAAKDALSRLE